MQDSKIIFAPAKLNIFLKVFGKRKDGFHTIKSGITFINLFDKIKIEKSKKTKIEYKGFFKPNNNTYDDCIIIRTLKFVKLYDNSHFNITITKNIPVQGGLGSASTNAAGLIKGLTAMNYIQQKEPCEYVTLGSDIPCFLFGKNCIAKGVGEKLTSTNFPKLYFLLVKPDFNNSTKEIYKKLSSKQISEYEDNEELGNDFEKIVLKESFYFKEIFSFLTNCDYNIFVRMSGTGSCCYAAFEKKEQALRANETFKARYNDLWTYVCENNISL